MYATQHVPQGHNPVHLHNSYSNHIPNGHIHPPHQPMPNAPSHHQPLQPPQPPRPPAQSSHKEPIAVLGVPSVTVYNNQLVVGDSQSTSERSYTPLKVVGDGSFGTVWLCDWHGSLPPNTPVSAMQCGAGARPEYAGRKLVAVKRMKKRWEGGWDECKKLKELESLRAIPYHPNIIPLYDFFLLPATKELYFVFESMEGNLYQLIKTRKGKPLAGGLVSSIFRQVVDGLHHIHASGYFHRDMKPENLLVTTTGLYNYRPVSPLAPADAPPERDVVVIVKLADFGLARETNSQPPYTEYVSTRWYRAPEVLLKSRDYSNPVDMWALGTIMAELVNLRPLFPGQGEIDQIMRITDLLGDPIEDYGFDARGMPIGGGRWPRGVKMAGSVRFEFCKMRPKNIYALFDSSVPVKLVECIIDLLKYDPALRLTSRQCLEHAYLQETVLLNDPPDPRTSTAAQPTRVRSNHRNGVPVESVSHSRPHPTINTKDYSSSHRPVAVQIPDVSSSHRSAFYESAYPSPARTFSDTSHQTSEYGSERYSSELGHPDMQRRNGTHIMTHSSSIYSYDADRSSNPWSPPPPPPVQRDWDAMDVSPEAEIASDHFVTTNPHQMTDIQTSPMVQEYPSRPPIEPEPIHRDQHITAADISQSQSTKFGKLGVLGFKKPPKWGLGGMFGHGDKTQHSHGLPPVQEIASAGSTPSLKRTQSSSTDSRSLSELSPVGDASPVPMDNKQRKKDLERQQQEAARQRWQLAAKKQQQQARAVIEKREQLLAQNPTGASGLMAGVQMMAPLPAPVPNRLIAPGPIRQTQSHGPSSVTVNAAGGNFATQTESSLRSDRWGISERVSKARRREFDDDHSMSSSDIHSGMSVISFATVDSDPGPSRMRHRPSVMGINRMTSMNSLRSGDSLPRAVSIDDYSGRSSASLSFEQRFANDFHLRASVDSNSTSLSDGGSPQPPLHMLSLSSPIPWQQHQDGSSQGTVDNIPLVPNRAPQHPQIPPVFLSPPQRHLQQLQPGNPYDQGGPISPVPAPKSAINPMFKVPFPGVTDRPGSLPPFSQLEAVADGEYPPLSPMSFTTPEDVTAEDS